MIHFGVRGYTNYFFAAKNLLIMALDINRIIALNKENIKSKKREEFLLQMIPQLADSTAMAGLLDSRISQQVVDMLENER